MYQKFAKGLFGSSLSQSFEILKFGVPVAMEKKKEEFQKIWRSIETTKEPYFVYAEKNKEKLSLSKAEFFSPKLVLMSRLSLCVI